MASFCIFFWSFENNPTEPILVHIIEGAPKAKSTKIWITSDNKCIIANNNSQIPIGRLKTIIKAIENDRIPEIKQKWLEVHKEIKYIV